MKGTSPTRSGFWPARHRSAKIEFALFNLITRGEVMEKITTVGIDLAKSVFSLHGVDGAGRVVLRRTVRRDQLVKAVAGLSPCLIGMEGVLGGARVGPAVPRARAHGAADGAQVRGPVQGGRQERRQRCRGDLRGSDAAEHAFCAGEVARAAGAAGDTQCQAGVRRGEDCDYQPTEGIAL